MCVKVDIDPLYEDNHLLVMNKPAGVLSQGDKTGDASAVEIARKYVKNKYNKPGNVFLGLCHRLDRPVSGVLILARTSKALSRMNELFRKNEVQKVYWAVSHRGPKGKKREGKLSQWLVKDRRKNLVKSVSKITGGAKNAVTDWRVGRQAHGTTLLTLRPTTGRSHQLRVLMQTLGCPIIGDLKYGGQPLNRHSIALHCLEIRFSHPVTKEHMILKAPLPEGEPWIYY